MIVLGFCASSPPRRSPKLGSGSLVFSLLILGILPRPAVMLDFFSPAGGVNSGLGDSCFAEEVSTLFLSFFSASSFIFLATSLILSFSALLTIPLLPSSLLL